MLKSTVAKMNSIKNVKKAISNNEVINHVNKMLKHFDTYNFLNLSEKNTIQFGFNSENLKNIIKNEWLLTNTIVCDQPAFQFKSLQSEDSLKNAFEKVKCVINAVPFSFIEVNHSNYDEVNEPNEQSRTLVELVRNRFKRKDETSLISHTFCSPEHGMEFFHKQERERKIWWKKFSALPGRFHTTEIYNDETNGSQFVEIQAEFPWGSETVEVIKYLPEVLAEYNNFFEMKNQRKKFIPQLVTCETSLEKAVFTYLCDSYEETNEENDREMLRFCRKLAPYKVSFAASMTSGETVQNLKDLVLLLGKKIRKCGISTLILPDICLTSLEKQFLRNDAIGVPYTILLNDKTLKDGIVFIRSRDTTLKEQSHVGLVVSYIEKLMKNY